MKKMHFLWRGTYCRKLFLSAFCCLLVSCLSWIMEMPSFTVRGVTLRMISFPQVNLLLDIDVKNPNHFDLVLQSFEYTIYLKDEEIGSGHLENMLPIPASSLTRVQAPVAVGFKNLGGSLKDVLTEANLPYKIEGKIVVKTALGSRQFPFSSAGRINLTN